MADRHRMYAVYSIGLACLGGLWLNPLNSLNTAAYAQSITPAIDGTGTLVEQDGNIFRIEGGSLSRDNQNLFHSFDSFGLTAEETAQFLTDSDIQNILGRVVGGDPSIIDGLLQVTDSQANLFLMNPAGIIFGAEAQLNVPSNFTATTATGIGFDNLWFNAEGENDYSSLEGDPSQFAFATDQPGSIFNEGTLSVSPGNQLMLVGGAVLNTGTLRSPNGLVAVVAVPGQNVVRLSQDGTVLNLEIETLDSASAPTDPPSSGPNSLPYVPATLSELLTGGKAQGHANTVELGNDGSIFLTQSEITIDGEWASAETNPSVFSLDNSNGNNSADVDSPNGSIPIVRNVRTASFVAPANNQATVVYGNIVQADPSDANLADLSNLSPNDNEGNSEENSNEDHSNENNDNSETNDDDSLEIPDDVVPETGLEDGVDLDGGGEITNQVETDSSSDSSGETADGAGTTNTEIENSGTENTGTENILEPSNAALPSSGTITLPTEPTIQLESETPSSTSADGTGVDPLNGGTTGAVTDVVNPDPSTGLESTPSGGLITVENNGGGDDFSAPSGNGINSLGDTSTNNPGTTVNLEATDGGGVNISSNIGGGITGEVDAGDTGTTDVTGEIVLPVQSIGETFGQEVDGPVGEPLTSNDTDPGGSVSDPASVIGTSDTESLMSPGDSVPVIDDGTIDASSDGAIVDGITNGNSTIVDTVTDNTVTDNTVTDSTVTDNTGTQETGITPLSIGSQSSETTEALPPSIVASETITAEALEGDASSGENGEQSSSNPISSGIEPDVGEPTIDSEDAIGSESTLSEPTVIAAETNPETEGVSDSATPDLVAVLGTTLDPADSPNEAGSDSASTDSPSSSSPPPATESSTASSSAAPSEASPDTSSKSPSDSSPESSTASSSDASASPESSTASSSDASTAEGADVQGVRISAPVNTTRIALSNADQAIANLEQQRYEELTSYFGRDLAVEAITPDGVQQLLTQVHQNTGNRAAIIYVTAPQSLPDSLLKQEDKTKKDKPDLSQSTNGSTNAIEQGMGSLKQAWKRDPVRGPETPLELLIFTLDGRPMRITVPEVSREQLFDTIVQFRNDLILSERRGTENYLPTAQRLYHWLIAPLEAELGPETVDTLLFAMDSGLRGLPIAALHDGEQFMVEKYSLGMVPSLGVMNSQHRSLSNAEVLAMGADTFMQQAPLPAVPVEMNTITDMQGGRMFLNETFTEENLVYQQTRNPSRIIHLATHAAFNPGTADQSFIQLWGNEQLSLREIQTLGWNNPSVDLLVLSACQTAVGSAEAEMGFAGLAVASGVQSALASLWTISDEGTLALMTEFYTHLDQAHLKAEALRQSQLAMLSGTVQIDEGQLVRGEDHASIVLPDSLARFGDRDLSHPYYWSGFTMIGNPW